MPLTAHSRKLAIYVTWDTRKQSRLANPNMGRLLMFVCKMSSARRPTFATCCVNRTGWPVLNGTAALFATRPTFATCCVTCEQQNGLAGPKWDSCFVCNKTYFCNLCVNGTPVSNKAGWPILKWDSQYYNSAGGGTMQVHMTAMSIDNRNSPLTNAPICPYVR